MSTNSKNNSSVTFMISFIHPFNNQHDWYRATLGCADCDTAHKCDRALGRGEKCALTGAFFNSLNESLGIWTADKSGALKMAGQYSLDAAAAKEIFSPNAIPDKTQCIGAIFLKSTSYDKALEKVTQNFVNAHSGR